MDSRLRGNDNKKTDDKYRIILRWILNKGHINNAPSCEYSRFHTFTLLFKYSLENIVHILCIEREIKEPVKVFV
jgi:hypothetical protein